MKKLFVATFALSLLIPALDAMSRARNARGKTLTRQKTQQNKRSISALTQAVKALISDCENTALDVLNGKTTVKNHELMIAFLKTMVDDPTLDDIQRKKIMACMAALTQATQKSMPVKELEEGKESEPEAAAEPVVTTVLHTAAPEEAPPVLYAEEPAESPSTQQTIASSVAAPAAAELSALQPVVASTTQSAVVETIADKSLAPAAITSEPAKAPERYWWNPAGWFGL